MYIHCEFSHNSHIVHLELEHNNSDSLQKVQHACIITYPLKIRLLHVQFYARLTRSLKELNKSIVRLVCKFIAISFITTACDNGCSAIK